jgi:hypothetical protein
MTPAELIELRKAGAKHIELNADGTLKVVEFFTNELVSGFAQAVEAAREESVEEVISAIDDVKVREEVEKKLREKLTYHSS